MILEEVALKDAMVFAYGKDLSIAPKADSGVGNEDSVQVRERNVKDVRR